MTADVALEIPDDLRPILQQVEEGRLGGARAAITSVLQSRPENYPALHLGAVIAMEEHRYQDSIELFRRAAKHAPDKSNEAMSWNGIGQAMRAQRLYSRAERAFRQAVQADPANLNHRFDFADTLAEAGKPELAEQLLREIMRERPNDPAAYSRLAAIWIKHGRQPDALIMLDMAKRCDPNYAPAYLNASVALAMLGKLDVAHTACNAALALDPGLACYYQLATLGELDDTQINTLRERTAADAAISADIRIDAGFALATVYANRGEYTQAFREFEQANRLMHGLVAYDPAVAIERVRRLQAFFTRELIERFTGKSQSALKPIFIVGMPRSGTTLTEQMLAAHSQIQAGGELPYLPQICHATGEVWGMRWPAFPGSDTEVVADLQHAGGDYAKRTAALRHRHERFTDKLPGNYLMLGMIHLMFPGASIINVRRDPFDTCVSCYEHLFTGRLDFTYDLHDVGAEYCRYEAMMSHWRKVLPPGRILDVDYEAIVRDPETQVRRILAHCQLPYEAACLNFQSVRRAVTTASATQVRQPIYQSSIGRWRHYRDHLEPLAAALARPLPE